jgi:hypothetical protein
MPNATLAEILFVDPFFDPYNMRFKNTMRECLAIVKASNTEASCDIHYRYHKDKPMPNWRKRPESYSTG